MSAEARFSAGSERPRGRGAPSAGLAVPPHLDLLVLGDRDAAAAYGLFWLHPDTATGLVEPTRTEDGHLRRYLARGGAHTVDEGDWAPQRIVVLVFPSIAAWEAFCEGPVDQDVKAIQDACSSARLVAGAGVGT